MPNQEMQKLRYLIDRMEKDLKETRKLLNSVELVARKDYREVPGVIGTFDGYFLTTPEGEKHEVPANYSAKSRLVFGDTLKLIEEDGKKLFKQITLVDRKRIEGVVNKKDGKWFILSESGSYRLNDAAVEFNKLQLNDKVFALIPSDDPSASYAALDIGDPVVKDRTRPEPQAKPAETRSEEKPVRPARKPAPKTDAPVFAPAAKPRVKKEIKEDKKEEKPAAKREENISSGEQVTQLLGDDDLR